MDKKKVLITGASRGIGAAIARRLSAEYSLILHATKEENLSQPEVGHFTLCADLSSNEGIKEFCTRLKNEHAGELYAIINNAGIALDKSLIFQPEKDIDRMLMVNLKAPMMICKTAMKIFHLKKRGVIINMSSCVAETGNAFQAVYTATKAGLTALSRSLAKEAAALDEDHAIRVLTVSPGFIETDMTANLPLSEREKYKKMIPANRFGTAADIAETVAFLLSEKAGYINGSTIHVNGGML